ncbi:hypothetical protein [Actinoplanes sp. NPDC051851]|uniref:hypothetical protein n=1 Tax=Actinoplanes sp. NPDC051851 TaxID=3154753 RepID=UPI003443C07A
MRRVARARLAGQVIRRLRRSGIRDARYHAATFEIRFTAPGDTEPTILQLAPMLGRPRRERLTHIAALLHTPGLPPDWSGAAPRLRPVLRRAAPGAPLHRPAFPHLSEFVVVDQPEFLTYVTTTQPATWNVTADEVFTAARANLPGAVLHGTPSDRPVVVRFVDDGNAYWTSHLLLPGWLSRLAGQVGGPPVAFAPDRGTLLVTADVVTPIDGSLLPALFAQAEEIFLASPHPLTPMAYTSDPEGRTIPYPAPPGHPLHDCVQRAEHLLATHTPSEP